jgi:biopolymer transport protein ExbD
MRFLLNKLKNSLGVIQTLLFIFCIYLVSINAQTTPTPEPNEPNFKDPRTLIVKIYPSGMIYLNDSKQNGISGLSETLKEEFSRRLNFGIFSDQMRNSEDVPDVERVEKTVWILPAANLKKSEVEAVINSVRLAGAFPIKMLSGAKYQKLLTKPKSKPQRLIAK